MPAQVTTEADTKVRQHSELKSLSDSVWPVETTLLRSPPPIEGGPSSQERPILKITPKKRCLYSNRLLNNGRFSVKTWLRACLVVGTLLTAQAVSAQTVTGNPITDGWTLQGNSFADGVFARTSGAPGALDFDVYAGSYTLAAGSNLLTGAPSWQVGDTVYGLGIVAKALYDITMSPMIKFGGVGSTYAADSDGRLGPLVDGRVSDSTGQGGEGSVLIRITGLYNRGASNVGTGNLNTPANNGAFLAPTTMTYYDGGSTSVVGLVGDAARFVTLFDTAGADAATSFAGLLNVSALTRLGGAGINDLPQVGAASVVSFMRSTGSDGTEAIAKIVPASGS